MMASSDLIGRARLALRGITLSHGSAQEVVALAALKYEDLMVLESVTAVVAGSVAGGGDAVQRSLGELQKRIIPELANRVEQRATQAKQMLEEMGSDVLVVEPTDGKPANIEIASTPGSSFFRSMRRRN